MINKDLLEKLETAWILAEDGSTLKEVNYDTIEQEKYFAVRLQTGSYTILQKAVSFDDKVVKAVENLDNTISFLRKQS